MMARGLIMIAMMHCGLSMVMLLATPHREIASTVPMMIGIPLLYLGVVGLNPHRRRLVVAACLFAGAAGMMLAATQLFRIRHFEDGRPWTPSSAWVWWLMMVLGGAAVAMALGWRGWNGLVRRTGGDISSGDAGMKGL